MNMLNQCIVEGVAKDAEVKKMLNGEKVLKFKLENKRYFKLADGSLREEISYIHVEGYGAVCKLGKKLQDKQVRLVGRMKQNRWQDETWKYHSEIVIVAEHIEMLNNGVTK